MNKKIYIINQYASSPAVGMGGRHFYIGKELSKLGWEVTVFAGSFSHLLRKPPHFKGAEKTEVINERFSFRWLKLPSYRKSNSIGRVRNWFIFFLKLSFISKPRNKEEYPEYIYYSSPGLIPFLGAYILAKRFKAKLIFEFRDIWPLTLVELGGFSNSNIAIRFMRWIESIALKRSDLIVSTMPGGGQYLDERGFGKRPFHWSPNGFSRDEAVGVGIELDTLVKRNSATELCVGYVGTIGTANKLDLLIDTAENLKSLNIRFFIVGKGDSLQDLKNKVRSRNLTNIIFLSSVEKNQVYNLLNKFDVLYLGWHKNNLYRYGISPNKLPEYFASGKPVVHSYSGNYDPVERFQAGLSIEAENVEELTSAFKKIFAMEPEERLKMGKNAKEASFNYYDFEVISSNLSKRLLEITRN